jgi:hypothetical protein
MQLVRIGDGLICAISLILPRNHADQAVPHSSLLLTAASLHRFAGQPNR